MVSYYNEIDPYAAQWLRNLIANKLIADGDVDERSICDVAAADLHGYTQCHFFAGIGVWSHALRLAGWPDDRPVWTGSCPCQPFSAAGKGKGFDDERHLWPVFHRLINECRPAVVFGEQVASKDGLQWLDAVCADMEASGYAIGAADMCAAGVGAPHIRQRLWFVGERLDDTAGARHVGALAGAEGEARNEARLRLSGEGRGSGGLGYASGQQRGSGRVNPAGDAGCEAERSPSGQTAGAHDATGGLANTPLDGRRQGVEDGGRLRSGDSAERTAGRPAIDGNLSGGLANADSEDQRGRGIQRPGQGNGTGDGPARERFAGLRADGGLADADEGQRGRFADGEGRERDGAQTGWQQGDGELKRSSEDRRPSPTNGHWRDADWLHCRDGRWRPVEPGTFPLVNGAPARVGRLRAYGNAIVPQVAAEVIGAYLDARP